MKTQKTPPNNLAYLIAKLVCEHDILHNRENWISYLRYGRELAEQVGMGKAQEMVAEEIDFFGYISAARS